jgi:hypothetical protein
MYGLCGVMGGLGWTGSGAGATGGIGLIGFFSVIHSHPFFMMTVYIMNDLVDMYLVYQPNFKRGRKSLGCVPIMSYNRVN